MDTALFFLELIQAVSALGILIIVIAFVFSFSSTWRRTESLFTKTLENLTYLSGVAREENIPKKVSALLDESLETVGQAKNAFSSLVGAFSMPKALGSAAREIVEETARFAKEKALRLGQVLSALLYGVSKGWEEFRKTSSMSEKVKTEDEEKKGE